MSSLFLDPCYDHDDGMREHFFWRSARASVYLHIQSPRIFDLSEWYHFASFDGTAREESDDLVRGMRDARAAWLRLNTPPSLLSQEPHDMRATLGTSDRHFEMHKMNDRRVASALYEEVQAGRLIFVPEREEMRACVKAIREERQRAAQAIQARTQKPAVDERARLLDDRKLGVSGKANTPSCSSGTGSTPLNDAQPFRYVPDRIEGNTEALAASTKDPDYAAKMLGYDRQTFGNMIHAMKDDLDLGGADNVIWHDTGSVEFNGQIIGNMHDYQ